MILLSICIPTYGRVEITKNTLNSIFSQNVDTSLYEVCISDNSPTSETEDMIQQYFPNKENLIYKKSTCEGFYNSIEALKLGSGRFLKLHNNYSQFIEGTLDKLVDRIDGLNTDSVLFFSLESITQASTFSTYESFDSFLNKITYFSTWSTSFGIWKEDFDYLMTNNVVIDKMFPHTSLLFSLNNKSDYYVDNSLYFVNQDVGKKGGYNLPDTFGNNYLSMCQQLRDNNSISEDTFDCIKKGILDFVASWYLSTKVYSEKFSFSFENWEDIITKIYGKKGVDYIKSYYYKHVFVSYLKKYIKKLIRK